MVLAKSREACSHVGERRFQRRVKLLLSMRALALWSSPETKVTTFVLGDILSTPQVRETTCHRKAKPKLPQLIDS